MEGGKEPSSDIRLGPLLGDALLRMHLNPKWVIDQLGPLDAC